MNARRALERDSLPSDMEPSRLAPARGSVAHWRHVLQYVLYRSRARQDACGSATSRVTARRLVVTTGYTTPGERLSTFRASQGADGLLRRTYAYSTSGRIRIALSMT